MPHKKNRTRLQATLPCPHRAVHAAQLHVQLPYSHLGGSVQRGSLVAGLAQLLRGRAVLEVELTQRRIQGVHHADGDEVAVALSLGQLRVCVWKASQAMGRGRVRLYGRVVGRGKV